MNTVDVYSAKELKEQFPDGFEYALDKWRESASEDIFWQDEIVESMKATFKAAGITLKDWSLGAYSPCYVKFNIPTYWSELAEEGILVDSYEGRKAYNWLKETFGLRSYKRIEYKDEKGKKCFRYEFKKLDGSDWDCEFTGYCADHDYLDALFDNIHAGMILEDSFHDLAGVCGKLIEQEIEWQSTEEFFLDHAEVNNYEYLENGRMI